MLGRLTNSAHLQTLTLLSCLGSGLMAQEPEPYQFELRVPGGPWNQGSTNYANLSGTGFPELDAQLPPPGPWEIQLGGGGFGRRPGRGQSPGQTFRSEGNTPRRMLFLTLGGQENEFAYVTALAAGRTTYGIPEVAGRVSLDSGEEFVLEAQQLDGDRLRFTRHPDETAEIPPGRYVVSVRADKRMAEYRIVLRPGEELTLPAPTEPGVLVDLEGLHYVARGGWAPGTNPRCARPEAIDTLTAWVEPSPGLLVRRDGQVSPSGRVVFTPPAAGESAVVVLDPDGQPIPDARIVVVETLGPTPRATARTRTGADGSCRVPARPGDRILVLHDGHAPAAVRAGPDSDVPTEIRLVPAREVELRVLDESGGLPPKVSATLEVEGFALRRQFQPDDKGRIRLTDVPVEGEIRATFRIADGMPRPIALPAGEPLVELVWEPGRELEGLARFDDGPAATSLTVELRDTTGRIGEETIFVTTDAEGRFRFPDVPPGIFLVAARTERDGHTWSGQTRVKANGDIWPLVLRDEDPRSPGGGR